LGVPGCWRERGPWGSWKGAGTLSAPGPAPAGPPRCPPPQGQRRGARPRRGKRAPGDEGALPRTLDRSWESLRVGLDEQAELVPRATGADRAISVERSAFYAFDLTLPYRASQAPWERFSAETLISHRDVSSENLVKLGSPQRTRPGQTGGK